MSEYAAAVAGVLRRDALIFVSYRWRFASTLAGVFLQVTLFYYVSRLVNPDWFGSPDAYFAFVVVGVAILQVISSTIVLLPAQVRHDLVAGTFERAVISPFGPVATILSMALFPLATAFLTTTLLISFAAIVFDMPIRWETMPLAFPVALLGAAAFAPFALVAAVFVVLVKQATVGVGFLVAGFSIVGGFFFPVSLLPDWIEWMSEVQPFTPALNLLRHLLVGTPLDGSAAGSVARLALFAAALLPPAIWALRGSVRAAQRRGTIIEY